jgi:hypothetical protein
VDSPHGVSTPEAYTSLAKGQAEVADNYMHLFVPRGAMAARPLDSALYQPAECLPVPASLLRERGYPFRIPHLCNGFKV